MEIMSAFLSILKEQCNFRKKLSKHPIKKTKPQHFCEPNFHPVILSKGLLYPQQFNCETNFKIFKQYT